MKISQHLYLLFTIFTLPITFSDLYAQEYKYEIGLSSGITGYTGDHYQSLPFGNPGYSVGGLFRYNRDFRSALKLELNMGTIDAVIGTNKIIDFSAQYEYNFFHFSDICKFKQTEIFTPYLSIGLGGSGILYEQKQKNAAFYIPIGFGVKWKAHKRINIGAEYSVRWYMSDNLDSSTDKIGFNIGKGNDWSNMIRIFVTFDFGKRLCDCPIHYYRQRKGY